MKSECDGEGVEVTEKEGVGRVGVMERVWRVGLQYTTVLLMVVYAFHSFHNPISCQMVCYEAEMITGRRWEEEGGGSGGGFDMS